MSTKKSVRDRLERLERLEEVIRRHRRRPKGKHRCWRCTATFHRVRSLTHHLPRHGSGFWHGRGADGQLRPPKLPTYRMVKV